ncbi:MAG: alpha/beta hydrolase [Bacillota bacterium]
MYFDYCGSKIFFEDHKNNSKNPQAQQKTIVFLHGWGCDSSVFAGIYPMFQTNYRCILVDFLGMGKSDTAKTGTSVAMQGEIVLSLCNYLEIKNFHIISHSYGGRVSIFLMSRENSRVKSGLLIAPAGVADKNLKKAVKVKIFKLRKKLTSKKNIKKLERFYSADYQNASGILKETFNLAIKYDQTSQLSDIKQKVLIVRGKSDSAITKKMVKTMKWKIKNCDYKEISGDHFAFLQSVLEFGLIAKDFFCV